MGCSIRAQKFKMVRKYMVMIGGLVSTGNHEEVRVRSNRTARKKHGERKRGENRMHWGKWDGADEWRGGG